MEQFICKTRIVSGAGSIAALQTLHAERLMLVCDPYFLENGKADAVTAAANARQTHIFADVKPDPSVETAARGALEVQSFRPDTIVALGGGSAIDTAKAMHYFSQSRAQLVAIPTTSGSGSEVTDFAILTHEARKHPLVDEALRPQMAVLDSTLVATLPQKLVAEGGFDMVSHAVESYAATKSGTVTRLLSADALRTALELLPASFGGNTALRGRLHEASCMAGLAFSNAGLGLCHAISHTLGGEYHIPHGALNAILLPAVIERNATAGCACYVALARSVGLSCASDTIAVRALKNALLTLRRNLRLPQTLVQAGICPTRVAKDMDALVASALSDPCCRTNPVTPDAGMVRSIITEVVGRA